MTSIELGVEPPRTTHEDYRRLLDLEGAMHRAVTRWVQERDRQAVLEEAVFEYEEENWTPPTQCNGKTLLGVRCRNKSGWGYLENWHCRHHRDQWIGGPPAPEISGAS